MESMLIYIWHLLITMGESKEGRKTSKTEKSKRKKLKNVAIKQANLAFLNAYNQEGYPFPGWFKKKKKNYVLIFAWQL
jgi:hypothetical protein